VLSAVVRITTNPRFFKLPGEIGETLSCCANLLHRPHRDIVQPGERHWTTFSRLCIATRTQGPRITDAWFAALAIEHGCTWITFDRDYARFPELDWREPAI
jgi:predicted nucleic acid-binding protein